MELMRACFYSSDKGEAWVDITFDLPDIPVNDIVISSSVCALLQRILGFSEVGGSWRVLVLGYLRSP